jgi:Helix-turn-helix domain
MSGRRTSLPEGELPGAKPLTVTVAAARRISGLGNTTLWALIKDRKLETVRIGRRRLITFRSLEALLTPNVDNELGP